jgi:hypothetical protein
MNHSETQPRKGSPSPRLDQGEFRKRYLAQFRDPLFAELSAELDRVAAAAWDAYSHSRKSPETRKAGPNFADPDYDLSTDWLAGRDAIRQAQARYDDRAASSSILLINCSPRSEHTCPGELSKSYRLTEIARQIFDAASDVEVKFLNLSRLAAEYGPASIPARRASRRRRRSVTGPARAIRTIHSARPRTG